MVKSCSSGYQLNKAINKANNVQDQMAKWCVLIAVVVKTARSARSYIRRGAMMSCMAIFGRVTHVIWLSAGEDPTSIFYLSNVVSDLAQGEVNSVDERSLLAIYST